MSLARVFLIDDDDAVRDSLVWALEVEGFDIVGYPSAEAFLDAMTPQHVGCVVSDIRMERVSGMELQRRLKQSGVDMPVILITGHASVSFAVDALRQGAFDFVEKPVDVKYLAERIRAALAGLDERRRARARRAECERLIAALTPREYDVFLAVVQGRLNKQIAADLGVSMKTVEAHRARVMEKLQVHSVAGLIRLQVDAGGDAPTKGNP